MKIVIQNLEFDYNVGCKLLKSKYGDDCPHWFNQPEIWNDIVPMTFKEITSDISNIEQRRVAINCIGLNNIIEEINPVLIGSETIKKTTTYLDENANLVTMNFEDTYNLFEVSSLSLGLLDNRRNEIKYHYVQCKDTSTDREYILWVDSRDVYETNIKERKPYDKDYGDFINPIQSIAWTFTTNVDSSSIEEIVRQGDCILIKTKPNPTFVKERHLTEEEYRNLLVLES